ncbi:hypothetical protein H2198_001251 [Neophaeococcomyces mojaviensis]|uniref:Uncharacterized protein n=1 Tax=Neophaeococcomyces mojaviensis TaxID=3383035 RepID=A0ACC3AI89_9EURO|nr:hypothetical protein H2198_001251 [Knufia sp. JES_112]
MILILLSALGILITLEALYRQSEGHWGIANVNPDTWNRYLWIYTPTVVLVLLATAFNVLDFELEFVDPYHELARGFTGTSSSVLWHPLKHTTPKTCLRAVRHLRFALVASSISVVVAPMLTIVVSALFSMHSFPLSQNVSAKALTWFNATSAHIDILGGEAERFPVPAFVLQSNMSYPQWTYDELAYPSIDLSGHKTGITYGNSKIILMDVPAARAFVNCTLIPESALSGVVYDDLSCVSYNLTVPAGCGDNLDWTGSDYTTILADIPAPSSGYVGNIMPGKGKGTRKSDNATVYCPTYYIVYGYIENEKIQNYSMYSCYLGLETVQTSATVSINLATVVEVHEVKENSSKLFQEDWNLGLRDTYFPYTSFNHPDEMFDEFTNVMVYGKDGIPREQLLDPDIMIQQFTHTYRQWVAQWIDTYMRNPVDELAKNLTNIATLLPDSLSGLYYDPNRQRLYLSNVSVRILQGIIAVLLICGTVILCLVDMSKVLPKPVGTIGAVASLLAGSRFVDEKSGLIPPGSEWLSDTELEKRGMWAGEEFRMGWWVEDGSSSGSLETDGSRKGGEGEFHSNKAEGRVKHFRIDTGPKGSLQRTSS